jgi:surface antigen
LQRLRGIGSATLASAWLLASTSGSVHADGGGNHFSYGYCTWGAAEQAHRAWGIWIPWFGDAGDWAAGARASGWSVSPIPQANTVIVMPRRVQGSGPDGHVGWVVDVDADSGGVTVLSMNWGRYNELTRHHVLVDGVVQFVAPPGSDQAATSRPAISTLLAARS